MQNGFGRAKFLFCFSRILNDLSITANKNAKRKIMIEFGEAEVFYFIFSEHSI